MSLTTVATTAPQMSGTLSVSLSTTPSTSAQLSSVSFASSAITATSSTVDPPTTSVLGSSTQPTTPSSIPAFNGTQSQLSSLLSSSLTTSEHNTIVPSTTISISSTLDPPSTIAFSQPPSPSESKSSPPVGTGIPLTTVLESTTVFVTSTNSQGQIVTSVLPVVTEVITTTGSGGVATTVTQAVVNPTLASNNSTSGGSSFFNNTGAVVGVFVVVGLASASILMWMLFAIHRRQRMRRIEQDTVIEAAVAAAGLNRAPLDDGDDGDSSTSPNTRQFSLGVDQRANPSLAGSSSLPTSARISEAPDDSARDGNLHQGFQIEHRVSSHPEGYIPARTTSPLSRPGRFDDLGSSRDRKSSYGHTPTYSAGSFEPLLANYAQNTADQDTPPTEQSRNPTSRRRNSDLGLNGYSSDGSPENGSRTSLRRRNSSDGSVPQEDEYTHYVLMVRNLPDNQSQHSE